MWRHTNFLVFSGMDHESLLELLGKHCFLLCFEQYEVELTCIAGSLDDFFSNIDVLTQRSKWRHRKSCPMDPEVDVPHFRCSMESEGIFLLHVYTSRINYLPYICGLAKAASKVLFQKPGYSEIIHRCPTLNLYTIRVNSRSLKERYTGYSQNTKAAPSRLPKDTNISVQTICKCLPFHFVFNHRMDIVQMGDKLVQFLKARRRGARSEFGEYFEIRHPGIEPKADVILANVNMTYELEMTLMPSVDGAQTQVRSNDKRIWTHCGLAETTAILQIICSGSVPWMKSFVYRLKFLWSLSQGSNWKQISIGSDHGLVLQ